MDATPSFLEDHISQIPALQFLQNMGYAYLRPQEVFLERKGKLSNFLLEDVLEKQLRRLNRIRFKGGEYEFTDDNIRAAIETLKEVPFDGLVRTSEKVYDLLSLGRSFEQEVEGDRKSFTIQYVDWLNPASNVFHVAEEFEVERTGSRQTCRPDIVLFVNGIPLVVIECKRPDEKDSLKVAVSQHLRNQDTEHIPRLFTFAQVLLAINKNEAAYATTGTSAKFWSVWREEEDVTTEVSRLINKPLGRGQKDRLFADRLKSVRAHFDEQEAETREVTEQDRALYCLCRPERLLELAYKFVVFDAGEKKIARYQQYFAVRNTLGRVKLRDEDGRRRGGVIWHTQGSGKSLTMVMLAKAIALDPDIRNPKIVLVTDRVDLDDQLYRTFHHCGKEPVRARTGKHLMEILRGNREAIIATTIFKFESGVRAQKFRDEGADIFVLVDESHRTQSGSRGEQYGKAHEKMRRVLPRACYIGFTGTPLMKKEKNTARQFGGFIDTYTIRRAVEDKAVVPLLYEGRHVVQEVDERAMDKWFEVVTKPLTPAQRADLKRKFSTADQLNKADHKIYLMAFDISEHFRQNWKGTGFKAQLTADSKASALKFKEYLDEFGQVTSEVLISGPDTREGNEEVERVGTDEVQAFWRRMMERYGTEDAYNKQLINAFKYDDDPEIIIVVDKLLTGFDAPLNTVLYLARKLQGHGLLQAVARVNRLWEGKDFGYVLDYYGVLSEMGEALEIYGALPEFDREDLEDALTDVRAEIEKLPQKHSELWDIFKSVKNRRDEEAYELELAKEDVRQKFYAKLSAYTRALGIALSTVRFNVETPEEKVERYKKDLAFFQKLRVSVKRRYSDEIDYREYEAKVQKLINTHVTSDEVLQITPPVNIFEQDKFQAEVEKLQTAASKADTIAHRTKRTITEKMEEDPYFYRRFSKILEEAIDAYREQRISDAEYLSRVTEVMNSVVNRTDDDLPAALKNRDAAKAFYGVVSEVFTRLNLSGDRSKEVAARAAMQIDDIIRRNRVVDWVANLDAQNAMRNEIDDYLYELKEESGMGLSLDDMDLIVENSIEIARARYA